MENARIVSDNACFGFDRAFCLTDFTSCQYEIATCNEEKFDTGPPDLDKFVQIQQKPKYGFFTKTRFLEKTRFFSLDLQFFGSLKLLVYIYIIYIYNTIYMYICICIYIYINSSYSLSKEQRGTWVTTCTKASSSGQRLESPTGRSSHRSQGAKSPWFLR